MTDGAHNTKRRARSATVHGAASCETRSITRRRHEPSELRELPFVVEPTIADQPNDSEQVHANKHASCRREYCARPTLFTKLLVARRTHAFRRQLVEFDLTAASLAHNRNPSGRWSDKPKRGAHDGDARSCVRAEGHRGKRCFVVIEHLLDDKIPVDRIANPRRNCIPR